MSSDKDKSTVAQKAAPTKTIKPGRRKSKYIIYAAITIIVLLAALAVPYFMWYQNPHKVVADGVMNALSAKTVKADGNFKYSDSTMNLEATVDGESDRVSGLLNVKLAYENKVTKVSVNTDAEGVLASNGDLYVKIADSKGIISAITEAAIGSLQQKSQTADASPEAVAGYRALVTQIYQPLSKQVDNNWIKIPANTVNPFNNQANNTQQCLSEAGRLAQEDSQALKEVIDAYRTHEFLTIDNSLGSNGSQVGYKVKISQQKASEFAAVFGKSKIGKKITSCVESGKALGGKEADNKKPVQLEDTTVELWINRWNHEISRIKSEANGGAASVDVNTDFNTGVKIEPPKESKTLQDIIDGLAGAR